MICPSCKTENPDATKFCGECGAKLADTAGSSGFDGTLVDAMIL